MQKPFDHSLPSRAEMQAAEAAKAKVAEAIEQRAACWRTIGIWAFGMIAFGMLGAMFARWLEDAPDAALVGLIGGAAGFGCLRLMLAERRTTEKGAATKR